MNKLALSFFLGLASADISLQAFEGSDCTGSVINNIHSGGSNPHDSSGCIATNKFHSVGIVSADSGFKCNVYSDNQCKNFLASFDTVECGSVIGVGVLCFSQALFDNPFAESTAQVTVGNSKLTVDVDGALLVKSGAQTGCNSNGCDPTTKFKKPFDHFNKECTLSVTMEGNFDSTNERDYMVGLLQKTMEQATTNQREDRTGSSENNDIVFDVPSFAQVVINDKNGNNQAQISVALAVDCAAPSPGDCGGILGTVTKAILGQVPAVGSILATAFTVTCHAAG